jgi:CxC1 like cysteine cluster associated with KDZ transposases
MPKSEKDLSSGTSQRRTMPYTGGLGVSYRSPVKRNHRKEKVKAGALGTSTLTAAFIDAIDNLDKKTKEDDPASQPKEHTPTVRPEPEEEQHCTEDIDKDVFSQEASDFSEATDSLPPCSSETDIDRLFANWSTTLDSLMDPFLDYMAETTGKRLGRPPVDMKPVCSSDCEVKSQVVLVLMHDCELHESTAVNLSQAALGFEEFSVQSCECDPTPCVLVRHGLFPTSPVKPRMAISMSLLDLYQALFERSCDAVTAFTDAIHTYYKRRGYVHRNAKVRLLGFGLSIHSQPTTQGDEVDDAWRRSIAQAIQWYDNLRTKVNIAVDDAMRAADAMIRELDGEVGEECSQLLQQKCPACFAGKTFGIATDAG